MDERRRQVALLDRYAKHLGIARRSQRPDGNGPLWDGETLATFDRPEDLAHEIAHWLVCPDEYRDKVDFGWMQDYQWGAGFDIPDGRMAPGEEVAACLIGFAMLARIGFDDLRGLYEEYGFIEWDDDSETLKLGVDVPEKRRVVQPYVDRFKGWLTAHG